LSSAVPPGFRHTFSLDILLPSACGSNRLLLELWWFQKVSKALKGADSSTDEITGKQLWHEKIHSFSTHQHHYS